MTPEAYPDDIEIKKTNFKTDQQEEAVETIADAWPTDLDSIAEDGSLPTMFYEQVLKDFLGPESEDLTFSQIESEYGSVEQWANSSGGSDDEGDSGDETAEGATSDVEDMDPGAPERNGDGGEEPGDETTDTDDAATEAVVDAAAADISVEGDVDEQRREWFAAGFRDGVAFALENPELFEK